MTINLISLETVKTQLGITDNSYDTQITNLIPMISCDIRRILNRNYDRYFFCSYANNSNEFIPTYYQNTYRTNNHFGGLPLDRYGSTRDLVINFPEIKIGDVLQGKGLSVDTYITGYNPETSAYLLSNNTSESGTRLFPTINISMWRTISQMIWYRITSNAQTLATDRQVKSKRVGPTSITYADSDINTQYNYPQKLINDLGIPFASLK